jgi:threonine/homoserine/homoserine lactone efflux protein
MDGMRSVIGEILPLSVAIAIGPLAIIAAVLMLLSPKAKITGTAFLVGWVFGITLAVVMFTLLALTLPKPDAGGSSPVFGVVKLILGGLLLLLAVLQWRSRPAEGEKVALPKWMSTIDSMTAGKAVGLGLLLAAVNPKNLLLAASAGVIIGGARLSAGQATVAITIYVVLATCTVLIPVSTYLVAPSRVSGPLDRLGAWLVDHSTAILAVLFLVLGVAMIGKGISTV